jgi:RNA ligase (TIGR02306 family)
VSNWNPCIVRIEKIEPHPNADRLEIAYVEGSPVVVAKGGYSVGDLAGYIPIDTVVPDNRQFEFLIPPKQIQKQDKTGKCYTEVIGKKFEVGSVPEQFRIIKAKKVRGVYSQGLLIRGRQVFLLCSPPIHAVNFSIGPSFKEGQSIVEFFNLTKWIEPDDDESKFTSTGNGNSEKSPYKVPYYDIENAKKFISCLGEAEEIVLEEKIHGCNAAFMHDEVRLWTKSRNLFKYRDPDCLWWDVAIRYNLEGKLAKYPFLTFFGEIYGQVKKFPYDTVKNENGNYVPQIRFFDIYDTRAQRYLDWDQRNEVFDDLNLPMVPLISISWFYADNWKNLQNFAEGKSSLGGSPCKEGFVLRTRKERFEPKLQSRMMLKYVSQQYNLSK